MTIQEKRPEFDTACRVAFLRENCPGRGKVNSDLTPREHGPVLLSLWLVTLEQVKSEKKKKVNRIVFVESVANLFPVSDFRLDSVWTEAKCVGQVMSHRGTLHYEHVFLVTFQIFKIMLQECYFSCR